MASASVSPLAGSMLGRHPRDDDGIDDGPEHRRARGTPMAGVGGGGGGSGGGAGEEQGGWGLPFTPVRQGEGGFNLMTPQFVPSPMQTFSYQESLDDANESKNRYKKALEAEMSRTKETAGRLAASEAQVTVLTREIKVLKGQKEEWSRKEAELRQEADRAKASARQGSMNGGGGGREEGGESGGGADLAASNDATAKELEEAKGEIAVLRRELGYAKEQCEMYKKTAEEGYREFTDSVSKIASRSPDAAGAGDLAARVKECEIMNKNLKEALEKTKGELDGAREGAKEVESLRKNRADVDALQARNAKLAELLEQATAAEAKACAERDSLQHWKVSLSIGLPEQSTPSAVVDAFKEAREGNIMLEGKVSQLEERIKHGEQEIQVARAAVKAEQEKTSKAEARVRECEGGLVLEGSSVERLKREVADYKLMLDSFKAEEVLMRDNEVASLREKLAKAEEELGRVGKSEAELKTRCDGTGNELLKVKQELERLRESQKREREQHGTSMTAVQKQKQDLQAQLDAEKTASSGARNKARENEMLLRSKAADAERQLKTKTSELERATKLHQDELEKTKTELQAKINTAKTALKDANSKARKGEDLERVLPSLLGISVGCQYRKSDDQTVRILLVTTKSALADKPETLFLKATIPAGDPTASIRLTLQENSSLKAGAMAENVAKHITSTAGTSAEHAGIPALFACVTTQEFERLAALATAEGGGGGVNTGAVESTAGSSSTVKDEPV